LSNDWRAKHFCSELPGRWRLFRRPNWHSTQLWHRLSQVCEDSRNQTMVGRFRPAAVRECFLISYFDPANRAQNNFTLTFGVDYTLAESLAQ
jgi:hypothetical protein